MERSVTMLPSMRRRWDAVGRKLAFNARDRAGWEAWRAELIVRLRELTGYDTMLNAPLEPQITETATFDDHVRQRVEIQTEPGVILPLYVLIPRAGAPPYPAVLAPHGHGFGAKAGTAGDRSVPQIAEAIDTYNSDYGLQLVRAGFIVFCPDARGFGERQEEAAKADVLASSCQWINQMAYPLGQTVTGMWTWELHRLLDYVETRDDCDPAWIGCAGLSGGGLQTLWATALDVEERIKCAVISGYLYGYRESLLDMHTNCSCNYVPHLWEYVDMGDIGALIAPRPVLIETGDRDPLNGASGVANVTAQIDIMRRAYRLFDAEDRLVHDVFGGEHRWHGVEAIPFMQRWLGLARH